MRIPRLIAYIFSLAATLPAVAMPRHELETRLLNTVSGKRAQIGIAVVINGTDTVTVNNDIRYPMMSVFKFHQALAVADYMERRGLPLSTAIRIGREDLRENTHSPLRDAYPQGEREITVGELLVYTLQHSDNNACDILFDRTAGTDATDAYIRSLGIEGFAISANENDMHADPRRCYDNWTTPLDAVRLLEIFTTRPILSDEYRSFVTDLMTGCLTGTDRLARPLLGTEAVIGHKTGTGDRNERGEIIGLNDIGFVTLPDGQRYTIAVFVRDSGHTDTETAGIIADISKAVYEYVTERTRRQ